MTDVTEEGRAEKQFCYDRRGNLVRVLMDGQVQNQYVYGPLNRMEQVWSISGEEVRYAYDGLGHRIGRQELHTDRRTDYIVDLTRRYHNLLQLEEEGEGRAFLWDNNVAGIIGPDRSHKFYLLDELGSPLRLADKEGKIRETYSYDEFGQDLYPHQGQGQPFGYTGYQPESVSGTYYAQTREYIPSAGRFASRDQDRFIHIQNTQSINLYNYCMSNPVRYTDPMGNDLEDQYPLRVNDENSPVQVNVSGNDITIDVFVDFAGDENFTTVNGTSCKDLTIAGIESWSGNYLDVFGEDVTVTVNVHEGHSTPGDPKRYIDVYFGVEDVSHTSYNPRWHRFSNKSIYMFDKNPKDTYPYTDEQYVRTVAHEMGHVLGIDDGYRDKNDMKWYEIMTGVTKRPDASKLGLIDVDDVMIYQFNRRNISSTDISMFILAYADDKFQSFADYTGHKQSRYFKQRGKQ